MHFNFCKYTTIVKKKKSSIVWIIQFLSMIHDYAIVQTK